MGAVIVLAVAAPWYIYMHIRYPAAADGSSAGFLYEFLVRQHFSRAMSGEFGHSFPPGTLLGILLGGFMPWTIFLPGVCARLGRGGWRTLRNSPAAVLLAAWPIVVLVAFSISRTQLPHYVMPAFPPLAILTGAYLDDRLRIAAGDSGSGRWFRAGLAVMTGIGVLFAVGAAGALIYSGLWRAAYAWWVAGIAVLAVAGSAAVWRRRHEVALALVVAGIAAIATFLFSADPFQIYPVYSPRYQIHEMKKQMRPGNAVISYPHEQYGFAWYMWGEPVLYPTPGGGPAEEPSEDVLVAELNRPRRTFCMLQKHAVADELRSRVRWPIRLVSERQSRYTLIVTEPPADVLTQQSEGQVRDR
jgi:4-amino-4-deoxy-L-arabinose transferase-like glycosyltransferase